MLRESFASLAGAIAAGAVVLAHDTASADAVTQWNAIMENTVATVDPFIKVRTATITQVAVFEAVNSILREYEPYHRSIDSPGGASPEAAAIAAAHRVLTTLHPDRRSGLDAKRDASLAAILDGAAKRDGIAVGKAAAEAIVALRANDGSSVDVPYTPGSGIGQWQPTPPDFAPAFRPGLGAVKPFSIRSGAQFRLGPPPAPKSEKYARDYREVKRYGDINSSERPQDRSDVARFYEATDAVDLYYPAARQVSKAQGKSLSGNARIFALLSIAIFDGAVAVFDTKYFYNYWRPATAIPAAGQDGNRRTDADPDWLPLVYTPPFPTYPSGHAGLGAAARHVLEAMYGASGHTITVRSPHVPGVVLHYKSWKQITEDVDDGRVFGGVHFRFDQEAAAEQGRRVGSYVLRHELRPRHGGD